MARSTNVSRIFGLISTAAFFVLFLNFETTNSLPLNKAVRCAVCTHAERARCPVVIPGPNCEVIDEPNCGCCKMCAKKVGENCGVATGLCETGLDCIPPPMTSEEYKDYGPADYFRQVSVGEFICVTRQQFLDILSGAAYGDENVEDVFIPELYDILEGFPENEDETLPTDSEILAEIEGLVVPEIEPVSAIPTVRPTKPVTAPFPNAEKPCIYHSEKVWAKTPFDHHEWIPSCEGKDGSYFPEQCELSFGREHGRCWCVDKSGSPISEFIPGKEASPELCISKVKET